VIPANAQVGQWLTVNDRHARLAADNRIVTPNGRSRKTATVSNQAFRLACNKLPSAVLITLPVRETPATTPVSQTA
jgi:hypothetical protein